MKIGSGIKNMGMGFTGHRPTLIFKKIRKIL
jgi:hypothetical protein